MTRFAVLAVAGTMVALTARVLASVADRYAVAQDPWRDPWYASGLDDEDPEPDLETLEAYARRVVALRVPARP